MKMTLDTVKEFRSKVNGLQDSFDEVASTAEMAQHEPTFDTVSASLQTLIAAIEDVTIARQQSRDQTFKFEKLKLPTFSGDFSEWQEFSDLFVQAIHNNGNIQGGAKMIYLKEALKGDAATIIANSPSTAAGYSEAWKKVEQRYSNKREIIFSHLRKFYQLKVQPDTSIGIRKICDTINECVRSLTILKVEVDKWDVIMVFLALTKMEEETKKQWLLTQANDIPVLSELLD